MRLSKSLLIVVGLALLAGSIAYAQGSSVERPFRMTAYASVLDEAPSDDCPFLEVNVGGEGEATHMGTVDVSRTHCFSPTSDPAFNNGRWRATAANGDAIWGTYEGNGAPLEFDDQGNPTLLEITGPYTIEGGSGRFEGATGEGVISGQLNLLTHGGNFVSEGTITY
jgi:hypothetical protein